MILRYPHPPNPMPVVVLGGGASYNAPYSICLTYIENSYGIWVNIFFRSFHNHKIIGPFLLLTMFICHVDTLQFENEVYFKVHKDTS